MVATSSVFATGFPHDEQKRTFTDKIVPQDEQVDIFLRYSLPREGAFRVPASSVHPPESTIRFAEPGTGSPICYHPKR